ncbi:helix-turn-helix transcriptional regulator [Mycolicibacterium hassiacum]|uniref:helix-turn-helix transcriptional regulator n=1 Tax=Mycolicibacterium hassiacum TaxID=46351 RepID=UPI0003065D6D|nr:helix-turn-helix transcriptional regulator [Mycolicibacterium hassiacum]MBX5488420.1 helix-turn-helix transcriptional regulator [Mycolicibacterium hassiacum]MDA4085080.1 AraC family transcriptional regulator [Mycolicibacterium hassiacum DSM 44199]PZN23177.1 MAG: AraC family transcriptional regulator [Mycolicibacterium hassiacum]
MTGSARGSDRQPEALRDAVAFIHQNAQRRITVGDIASSVNVTPRSVQYMFRRHLGTTPLGYLRQVRLDHAHRDLETADPTRETVMDVAKRWGFHHAGRFSAAYKRTFGEPPSQTLRASRDRPVPGGGFTAGRIPRG